MSKEPTKQVTYSNPADRLYRALNSVPKTPNILGECWAELCGAPTSDVAAQLAYHAILIRQVLRCRELVLLLPKAYTDEDRSHYLGPIKTILDVLGHSGIRMRCVDFRNQIDDSCLSQLRGLAGVLRREFPEEVLSDDDVKTLLQYCEKLKKEIGGLEIDDTSRNRLLRHVTNIERALLSYGLTGIEPVQDSLDGAVGATSMECAASEEKKEKLANVVDMLSNMCKLVDTLPKALALGEAIAKFILPS